MTTDACREGRLLIVAATGNAHKLGEFRAIFSTVLPPDRVEVISQKQAAEAMGYKGQPGIGQMLRRTNGGRLDKFVQLMDSLGYEVVVRDKDTKNGVEWTLDK